MRRCNRIKPDPNGVEDSGDQSCPEGGREGGVNHGNQNK